MKNDEFGDILWRQDAVVSMSGIPWENDGLIIELRENDGQEVTMTMLWKLCFLSEEEHQKTNAKKVTVKRR